jgi:hypothetical protein
MVRRARQLQMNLERAKRSLIMNFFKRKNKPMEGALAILSVSSDPQDFWQNLVWIVCE